MACLEYNCKSTSCSYHEFNNEILTACPRCGERLMVLFDEFDLDHGDRKEVAEFEDEEE